MTDQTAALAKALLVTRVRTGPNIDLHAMWLRQPDYMKDVLGAQAAAVLAALPRDWYESLASHRECGESIAALRESHLRELDEITADVARLRAIEAAARSVTEGAEPHDFFEGEYTDYLVPVGALDALHAALAAEGERP